MPVVTFDDIQIKPTKTKKSNIVTFEDIPTKEKDLQRQPEIRITPSRKEQLIASMKRKGALGAKAVLGDIPYARKLLPESWKETVPYSGVEKVQYPLTRLGRDIGLFAATEGVTSVIPWLAKAKLASQMTKMGLQGAAFGAVTAGTEEPKEIAEKAITTGAILGAVPPVFKGIGAVGKPIVSRISKYLKPKITPIKAKIVDLIRKRYSAIQTGLLDSEIFIKDIEKKLTTQERELIPFIKERTAIPRKLNRPDLMALMKEKGHQLKETSKEIGGYLDEAHQFLVDNYGQDIGFWENYLPHIWDIPKNKMKETVNWFVTRNPHIKRRFISTIQEGVNKFNLKPKTLDIASILRTYDQLKIKAVANLKFVKGVTDLKTVSGYTKRGKPILTNLVQRADKAPPDWIMIDHPALRRGIAHMGKAKDIIYKQTLKAAEVIPARPLIVSKIPIKAHPEIANEIKVVLDRPFSGTAARALDTINAFVKKGNLSLSLFHHLALGETAIATPTVGRRMLKLWNPIRAYKAIKSGNYGAFENIPLSRDAVQHGLQLGAISDVQVGRIRSSLLNLESKTKSIPIVRKLTKGIRTFNDMWDKHLWGYYHTSLKLYGYEGLVQRNIKAHPNLPVEVIKKETAQFVNDTFGGQAWDLLLKNPKWQQSMHWLLLSPDWTLSTVRQAISPTGAGAVTKLGQNLRAEMGQDFWKRAVVYFWGGMNLLNKSMTEVYTGKGRYMWDNAPGHKTHLFLGLNPDGTEKYLRWGKQFRELPEFFINPPKKAWAKVSPIIRMAQAQFVPHPQWQKDFYGKPFWNKEALMGRGKQVLKSAMPYAISGAMRSLHPLSFAFPISKGMTPYKGRELFKDAIQRKDKRYLREIWASALNNNLNAESLFKQARSSVKSDITFEFKKEAQAIIEQLRVLGKERGMQKLRQMRESGELGPELEQQIRKIIKQQKSIKQQKRKLEERLK